MHNVKTKVIEKLKPLAKYMQVSVFFHIKDPPPAVEIGPDQNNYHKEKGN